MSITLLVPSNVPRLTLRESEVLQLAAEGKSSKKIAAELCCSKRTVDFHLRHVYIKLGVSNRIQAVVAAGLATARW